MSKSVCLLEFHSISKAFSTLNDILLRHTVKIFLDKKICPGRYIILFEGNENDIKEISDNIYGAKGVLCQIINSISEELINVLKKKSVPKFNKSIGIFEFVHTIDAIKLADIAIKQSGITINKIDFSLGLFGKGIIYCSGNISNLEDFKKYILENCSDKDIIGLEIILRPCEELINIL